MAKKRREMEEMYEAADETSNDRDDLIEAGKQLRLAKAREAREQSNLGVGTEKKAFKQKKRKRPA